MEEMDFSYWRDEVPVDGRMGEEQEKGIPVWRIARHQGGHGRGIALLTAGERCRIWIESEI